MLLQRREAALTLPVTTRKADSYRDRIEAAEIARVQAAKNEVRRSAVAQSTETDATAKTFAKVSLADAERRRAEAAEDREAAEIRARQAEERVRELEAYLEDEGGDHVKARRQGERLNAELEELRGRYERDMNERDFTVEATRQRFQKELEAIAVRRGGPPKKVDV